VKRLQWGEREDGLEEIWKKEDGKRAEKGDWGRGEYRKPFLPHGLEGLALVGTREKRRESLSPCG